MRPLIPSLLYDDLYKFTQFQAVYNQFPRARARYKVQDRQPGRGYPKDMDAMMREQIAMLADLRLTSQEGDWLRALRFSKPTCVDAMGAYRYDPREVETYYQNPVVRNGYNEVATIEGPWYRTIWWEVKLLLLTTSLSNYGFEKLGHWKEKIDEKGMRMIAALLNWIDFGTRRAFDMETQPEVVSRFLRYYTADPEKPGFRGTSNMYLALINNIACNGTIAHEFFMAMQAAYGFSMSNRMAMEHWIREYEGDLGIVLPDTLTTDVFLRSFDRKNAKLWDGVRLDSGDPVHIAMKFVSHYEKFGINPTDKLYVPSDGLTDVKAISIRDDLRSRVGDDLRLTAGIGTFLVNDCGYEPRSVVCKLDAIDIFGDGNWVDVVKFSDAPGKYSGNPSRIAAAKAESRIP